jgi:hypothetical protein
MQQKQIGREAFLAGFAVGGRINARDERAVRSEVGYFHVCAE